MLKRLVILCVLVIGALVLVGALIGQDAVKGTPKQGIAKSNSGRKGQEQLNSQFGNQSTPSSVTASPKPAAPTCDETCQQGRENLQIQHRLAIFTLLLVIVGALQVGSMIWQAWLLRQTRGDVHSQLDQMVKQVGHMEKQTEILDKSVTAAQASANAASAQLQVMKSKERAQLRIEFDSPLSISMSTKGTTTSRSMSISYQIQVLGTTRATILHSSIAIWVPHMDEELNVSGVIDLPNIVFPSEDKWHFREVVRENSFQRPPITDQKLIAMVMDNTRFVVVQGRIRYQDVFGDVWILPFSVSWKNNSFLGSSDTGGYWEPYKDPYGEENREYLEQAGHYMARAGEVEMPSKTN